MIINFYKIVIVVFVLIFANSLKAQDTSNIHQDIWLVNISTPYTLNKGGMQLDMFGRYTNYGFPDPRTDVADFIFVGNYGITGRLNLSVMTPFSWISGDPNNFGFTDILLGAKYKLLRRNGFTISLSPILSLPVGKKEDLLGSGKVNLMVDVNVAFNKNHITFFTNGGFGKNQYVQGDVIVNPSGSFGGLRGEVRNEYIIVGSGGVSFDLLSHLTFLFEGVGQIVPEFSDKDFYFQVGGILRIHNSLRLKGSGGLGLPSGKRSIIDARVTLGFSYLMN